MHFIDKLHARLGDFWYYSFLMFCASRAADILNAFVGLWLVPKYIPPSELGAVLPIMNFASFLAFPMAVFTATFRNEITGLALRGEFGRLKTLMRGVFIASALFLFVAVVASHFLLPHFLERIRIVEGSLGLLILATTFVNAVHPVYSTAMQALKKFSALSVISLVSAPLRLVTMLIAMPFRALTGYFVGQISSPVFSIIASIFALKKEFSVPAEPYWSGEVARRLGRFLLIFAIGGIVGNFAGLVELTVLRQRLSDLDSAAYYMVTRFSDIASFLYVTLVFTLFPFTAELAAKGKDLRPIVFKTAAATIAFSGLTAGFFFFTGEFLLGILPHGSEFSSYWWAIPWIIGINTMTYIVTIYTTAEVSANRFRYMWWMIPLSLAYPVALLVVTGRGYFASVLPEQAMSALENINVTTLEGMLWWMTAIAAAKLVGVVIHAWLSPQFRMKKTPSLPSPKKCCGCSACYAICPQKAITMQPDAEGFLQPNINYQICTNCGRCENVCPVLNPGLPKVPLYVFAARAKDEETLSGSSSGGLFTVLAKHVIDNGGVVYGAAWSLPSCDVKHRRASTLDELDELRGSKYVQSEIGDMFNHVKHDLSNGRKVLFSGCPCQIAGLKKFIGKNNSNLLTVDLICHGVPSPLAWKLFLKSRINEFKSPISKVVSRRYCQWKEFPIIIEFETHNGPYTGNGESCSFLHGFFNNYFLRESCHNCTTRSLSSGADITIGDFWGIEKTSNHIFNDDKGVSAAIISTDSGLAAWNSIAHSLTSFPASFDFVCNENPTIKGNYPKTWRRKKFFDLLKTNDFDNSVETVSKMGIFRKCHHFAWWFKRLVINREINEL